MVGLVDPIVNKIPHLGITRQSVFGFRHLWKHIRPKVSVLSPFREAKLTFKAVWHHHIQMVS